MIHEAKLGLIQKGGNVYYTCKVGMGHKVNVIMLTSTGKWIAQEEKVTVVGVVIYHRKGCGLPEARYECDNSITYPENRVHRTLLDARIMADKVNRGVVKELEGCPT